MSDRTYGLTRREALMATAGAAVAPALGSMALGEAQAAAPMMGAARPTHFRYKLGEFEITAIWDGAINIPKIHPIFGNNKTPADVRALAEANFLPGDKMSISFTPVIINTGKELVLIDAGNGVARRAKGAGRLAAALSSAGFSADQVDVVATSHYHPDHIGGLMEGGKPLFPNARYVTGEAEYNFWSPKEMAEGKLARVGKLVQSHVVPLAEKTTFVKPGGTIASGITAVDAMGHTPGHLAFHIESGGSRLIHWVDTCNHYVASLQRPDWHVSFDMDKEKAVVARKRILDMVAADKILASGYHMPFPAVGYVEKKDLGYRWVPTSYQLDL